MDPKKLHLPEYITTSDKDKLPSKWGWLSSSSHNSQTASGLRFKFPVPDVTSLRLSSTDSNIIKLEKCSFKYSALSSSSSLSSSKNDRFIMRDINFSLTMKNRVAIVGPNGQGKLKIHDEQNNYKYIKIYIY